MPFEMAMQSELSRRQFHSIAQALLSECDKLKADIADPEFPPKHARRLIAQLRQELSALWPMYDSLKAELAGLRTGFDAQNEVIARLRKDVDRYQWLKSRPVRCPTSGPDLAIWDDCCGESLRGDDADAAIDAAMAKGGEV